MRRHRSISRFRLIGHRGAPLYVVENTIESFEKAISCGATGLEFDVRATKDGMPVIFHDEDLRRLAGINRKISDLTLEEVHNINLSGFRIPTLEEVLSRLSGRITFDIEVKVVEASQPTVKLVSEYCNPDDVIVSSFDVEILRNIRKFNRDIEIALIIPVLTEEVYQTAEMLGTNIVIPNLRTVLNNPSLLKTEDFRIIVWTVNSLKEAEKLIDLGCEGIITDDPCSLRPILDL